MKSQHQSRLHNSGSLATLQEEQTTSLRRRAAKATSRGIGAKTRQRIEANRQGIVPKRNSVVSAGGAITAGATVIKFLDRSVARRISGINALETEAHDSCFCRNGAEAEGTGNQYGTNDARYNKFDTFHFDKK